MHSAAVALSHGVTVQVQVVAQARSLECFIANCCYTVASIDTRCIDSNLESGRYISRVGRASRFLSLGTVAVLVPQ